MAQPPADELPAAAEPARGFLSYSRTDLAAATELHERLRAAGLGAYQDVADNRGGERWFNVLEQALARSQWFLVLVGREGVAGWVGAETQVALTRHFSARGDVLRLPIVPLLLGDAAIADLPPLLALFQATRWAPGQALPADLLATLRAAQPRFAHRPLAAGECPYRGLAAFRASDSHLFFGRSAETLHAISLLGNKSAQPPDPEHPSPAASGRDYRRWLQVEGNSGAGKSSLVQAGMLPMIERGALWPRTGIRHWRIVGSMLPGTDPVTTLAEALAHAVQAEHQQVLDLMTLRDRLRGADPSALALALRQHRPCGGGRFLLVVDQFEELITFAEPAARATFDAQLAHALGDPECPLFLLSTVRSDFLDRIELLPRLAERYPTECERYALPPVGTQGLREAIEMPGRLAGVDTAEVATQILADARDEPGALPLAENALTELWREARPDAQGRRTLSGEAYEQRGRLAGMLAQGADALLDVAEHRWPGRGRRGALELLLALTRINPHGRHTRQRLAYEEAVNAAALGRRRPAGEQVLRLLAGERDPGQGSDQAAQVLRLVTIEGQAAPVDTRVVDLIHETLLRTRGGDGAGPQPYWPTLHAYIDANRDRDVRRQMLALLAGRWQRASRWDRGFYLAGLWELLQYRGLRPAEGSPEERYLRHSRRFWQLKLWLAEAVTAVLLPSAWYVVRHDLTWQYAFVLPLWAVGLAEPVLPEAVELPAGRFEMGCMVGRDVDPGEPCPDDQPWSKVEMPAPCAMGRTEVTFWQYDFYVWSRRSGSAEDPLYPEHAGFGREQRPVINVNWNEASAYAQWLAQRTGQHWRLPTEAEWEYAARGGQEGRYPWGNEPPSGRANCADCGDEFSNRSTAPVQHYPANGFGLHDMAGNVWEWTSDRFEGDRDSRVLRGGSWYLNAGACARPTAAATHPTYGSTASVSVCVVFPPSKNRPPALRPLNHRPADHWAPRSGAGSFPTPGRLRLTHLTPAAGPRPRP